MNDLANPSGALKGDPRYGLTDSELKLYYMNKSPCWFIHIEQDTEKFLGIDDSIRQQHTEYLNAHSDKIRFVGPLKEAGGINITGVLILLDSPDRKITKLWIENDPYFINNLYKGTMVSGNYNFSWDGNNAIGKQVSSGTYFLVVSNNYQTLVEKMLYLK